MPTTILETIPDLQETSPGYHFAVAEPAVGRRRRQTRRQVVSFPLAALFLLLSIETASAISPPTLVAAVPETERLYLSGTGRDDTVEWEFSIDRGRRSGDWTTIAVPSQWELQGFGEYGYGRHDEVKAEVGSYRYRFEGPSEWSSRRVRLVFEGAMTDTEVRINGESAGPVHQGGFTRFGYDVTDLLFLGRSNLLEVTVSEASADDSVNAAEREADYWVFGGLYRPVYLEAYPEESIEHVAIDARHDGRVRVVVETVAQPGASVEAVVRTLGGKTVGVPLRADLLAGNRVDTGQVELKGEFTGVSSWSAEHPNLYRLEVVLRRGEEVLHSWRERFGFRTIEIRAGDGIFVNDRRILLKGINRHSFWPDSGRTLDREINRSDAELIKDLNANAVRTSHYPPDIEFLEAADELGLYVIDELPGWHDAYRTGVGRRLVREMVRRDVNHPSIILWANGNEGGWNRSLDTEFARHDTQDRWVIHPQELFSGIDTEHYPNWDELTDLLADSTLWKQFLGTFGRLPLVLPTEMLHGLYDGGLGAGLEDYWRLIRSSPRGAGGFLWAFLDEGVVRTDRGGEIDTHGNYAPDGLVGPYRDKEASFFAVRELWSPVVFSDVMRSDAFTKGVEVENRFTETDLAECTFLREWLRLPGPLDRGDIEVVSRTRDRGPRLAPGEKDVLDLGEIDSEGDALRLTVFDPTGREVLTRVFRVRSAAALRERWFLGRLQPRGAPGQEEVERQKLLELRETRGLRDFVRSDYSGWSTLELEPEPNYSGPYQGMVLGFGATEPEGVAVVEWLGAGPGTVWANRRTGTTLGLWRQSAAERSAGGHQGFYANALWMKVIGRRWTVTILPLGGESPEDDLFVGVPSSSFPADALHASSEVPPPGTFSFLLSIPPIGTKFHPPQQLGPQGQPRVGAAHRSSSLWFLIEPTASSP